MKPFTINDERCTLTLAIFDGLRPNGVARSTINGEETNDATFRSRHLFQMTWNSEILPHWIDTVNIGDRRKVKKIFKQVEHLNSNGKIFLYFFFFLSKVEYTRDRIMNKERTGETVAFDDSIG